MEIPASLRKATPTAPGSPSTLRRTGALLALALTASLTTAPAATAAPNTTAGYDTSPAPHAAPTSPPYTSPTKRCDTKPFQRALEQLRGVGASGISVTVKSPRCGLLTSGVGRADLKSGREVTGREHSRIASNTKTWTATVVLQLVGEGKLRLDDTVDRHLPGLVRTRHYDGRKITIRQLLQHTSGLPDYLEAPYWENETAHRWDHTDPLTTVKQALAVPPADHGPRHRFSYSNTNYNLLGLIVGRVTGHRIGTEIDRRIVRPLGLRHTSWPGDRTSLPAPALHSYVKRSGKLRDWTEWNVSGADASGALVSNGPDISTFWTALMSGKLLAPAQLAEMKKTVRDPEEPGGRYGLGVERYEHAPGEVTWGHSGFMETGHKLRNAVTDDGSRTATLLIGSEDFKEKKVDTILTRLLHDLR